MIRTLLCDLMVGTAQDSRTGDFGVEFVSSSSFIDLVRLTMLRVPPMPPMDTLRARTRRTTSGSTGSLHGRAQTHPKPSNWIQPGVARLPREGGCERLALRSEAHRSASSPLRLMSSAICAGVILAQRRASLRLTRSSHAGNGVFRGLLIGVVPVFGCQ